MLLLRGRAEVGGFDFMPRPNDEYYRQLPGRIGTSLSAEQVGAHWGSIHNVATVVGLACGPPMPWAMGCGRHAHMC